MTLYSSQDGIYSNTTTNKVDYNHTFMLPNCMFVPQYYEFLGWVETTDGNYIVYQEGEMLRQPGEAITVTADVTYYARYQMTDISLTDATDNLSTIRKYDQQTVHSFTLTDRTLWKDGSWNTLCLPFALSSFTGTPLEGATVKTLESASFNKTKGELTLDFSTNNLMAIEAGKPYIVKWEDATPNNSDGEDLRPLVFNNVTISIANSDVATDVVTFTGTYSPVSISSEGDNTMLYLGINNTLYWPNSTMAIGCQRAYFQLNGITAGEPDNPQSGNVRAFVLNFYDESTGVSEKGIVNREKFAAAQWFTLDGRRLNGKPSRAGVYINNGNKVVIK